jgi:hypothetical protein
VSRHRAWVLALVPLAGLVELAVHLKQANGAVPDADWLAARDAVTAIARPEDLVVFAPHWVDPIGRRWFGDSVATLAREARPDETRFPRAIEVSIRGKHTPELAGWQKTDERQIGKVTIATLVNPSPAKVIDDLLAHDGAGMRVSRLDGPRETDCPYGRVGPQTGGLGFGPAIPGARFMCSGGSFVGITVLPAIDYSARRCFYAPPPGGPSALRLRFEDVRFGTALHGHHGIYVEAERNREGVPVSTTFRVGDRVLGTVTHHDGDGWKGFELPTSDLAGTTGELVADVTAANGNRRMYCFEADTR